MFEHQGNVVTESLDKLHRFLGIDLNQQTWSLLNKKDRDTMNNNRMIAFSKASLYHWKLSPEFEPVNEQRGEWLISHVYAVLEKGENALIYAKKCWEITERENLKDLDLAYALEALARAYAALENSDKMNEYFLKAKSAGENIEKKEDLDYFLADFHAEPWFECTKPIDD